MQRAACLALVLAGCAATTVAPPPPQPRGAGPVSVDDAVDQAAPLPSEREPPIACGGDELIVLSDCVIDDEVAVEAHGNCQVTLTNCAIRGSRVAIDAHGNAQVVISGGSVSGAKAIDAHGNAQVVLEGAAITGVIDQHGDAQIVTR